MTENGRMELIKTLMERNYEFRKAYSDHRAIDEKLAALNRKKHLTIEEEMELKRLQKLKLKRKDEFERILSVHEPQAEQIA